MTLQNIMPYLIRAQREGWAVGAFNANTLEQVQAIAWAARDESAPAVIQLSYRALTYVGSGNPLLGMRVMAEIARVAAESVAVPLSLHLDHAPEMAVMQAMALGFTSVMFDGGNMPLGENITTTRRVVEAARKLGIAIEAELGEVPRSETGSAGAAVQDGLTSPEEAAEFVQATGIDTLAIALGSVHAVREKTVSLDLDRLRAIRKLVAVPLVLHGSSGVNDAHIQQGIAQGLVKINVATQLNQAFTSAVREKLSEDPGLVDPRKYLELGRAAMVEAVRERMQFFGASGKA